MSDKITMVGYTRVSTSGQADNGHSLDAQRAAITAAAEQRGWEIIWANDAASGKNMQRKGMEYALSLVENGQAQGIVATKLDRISRSGLDFATLLERAQREEWNIVLLDLGLDLWTPMGKFTASVMSAVAELERNMISERTKTALAIAKTEKGIVPGPKSKVPQDVVQAIREMNSQGMTLGAIAHTLTQQSVPLPSGTPGVWSATQVGRVLKRG